MTNNTNTLTAPVNTSKVISGWAAAGRNFTNARNAGIARLLVTGTKASVIVADTGIDKGDVSRINSLLKGFADSDPKLIASLKRLKFPTEADATDLTKITAWVNVGARFVRVKSNAGTRSEDTATETPSEDGASVKTVKGATDTRIVYDALQLAFDTIVNAPEEQAAEWLAVAQNLFTVESVQDARDALSVESEESELVAA